MLTGFPKVFRNDGPSSEILPDVLGLCSEQQALGLCL